VDRVRQLLAAWAEVSEWETGPGAVAAVVQDGLVIASAAYGLASLEHGLGLSARTVLDVGSVSKQFTDFAIVLLAQRGLLNLDDDIRTHLREVPNFGTTIRIRHLIHHMSGIREIYGSLALTGWQAGDGIVQEDALGLVTHMRELNFEPGTEYLYCNTAYMLLADIVSRASGKPFAAFMEDEIFGPLGMEFTTIMAQKGQVMLGAADSYALEDGEWERAFDNSGIQGAGGIYTTVGDLARWLYNFRTGRVGGPAAIAQMQERGVLSNGDTLRYAFGLNVGTYRGLRTLAHSGSSAGYRARLLYFPDEDLGILQQANSALTATPALMEMLADAMLEEILAPAVVEEDDDEEEEPRGPSTWTPTLTDLRALEGVYFSPELEATWTLRVDEGRLEARHARLEPLLLEPQAADRFSAPYPLNEIRVERDSAGNPVAFRVSNGRVKNLRFERR
jgi:CubicO group peptidase (beta-lactamase class C family)